MWSQLPTDLIRRIVYQADLPIDTRLAFKCPPRKIHPLVISNMNNLFASHDGIVYNTDTQTLFNFRIPGWMTIRRPISLRYSEMNGWIFNTEEASHSLELIADDGSCILRPGETTAYQTHKRVLLVGTELVEPA